MRDYLTWGEILEATGGRLRRGDPEMHVQSFSTDTRTLRPGDLFIALPGPNFDGHHFVLEALRRGAIGAVVSSIEGLAVDQAAGLLEVEDTLSALGEIASLWRRLHPVPLVAVTGSAGKTTTKEWATLLLGRRYRVLSSPGSFNNLIGLPLTLLQIRQDHQMVVAELGTSARGEIRRLSQICQPDIGLITNIGAAHLEFLGSLEGVLAAKAEMLEFLGAEKTCILNGEDPYLKTLMRGVRGRCFTYGLSAEWDLWASGIVVGKEGTDFQLRYGPQEAPVHLSVWGRHNLYNALAAAAIGVMAGLSLQEVGEALSAIRQPPMRMEKVLLPGEAVLINDAYNANPLSMRASLGTFFEMKGEARGILVLGDMLELGSQGERLHREIGAILASYNNVGALIAVGPHTGALAEEAQRNGFSAPIFICQDQNEASLALRQNLRPKDWVLLKGSRAMKMEKVLEGLN